jgi:O-antigen ligase
MNALNKWNRSFSYINGIGLVLISICFLFMHLNSKPAQTQLTYLPMLLPLFLLLPLRKEVYKVEIQLLIFTCLIFISSLISYGAQGDILTQDFRSHWTYLLVFGVLSVLIQTRITKDYLYTILILSGALVLYNVGIEFFNNGSRGWQTHGKPIFFGNIALTTGLVSLVLSLDKNQKLVVRVLLLLAAVAGVAGSLWSLTRGGWVFLVLFLGGFILNQIITAQNKRKAILLAFGLLVTLCLIALPFTQKIESRINNAYSNIENYFTSGNSNTSLGLRFEFWRVSVEQFMDDPIIGSARVGFLSKKDQMISDNNLAPSARGFEHAHSDLFWTMGTKGLLGLFSLYGLYLFLLRFYYISSQNKEVRFYALSGLTVVTGYMVYGLSESFFSMKLGIGYFLIINLVLIRLISLANIDDEKPLVLFNRE